MGSRSGQSEHLVLVTVIGSWKGAQPSPANESSAQNFPWNHLDRGLLFLVLSYKEAGAESGHPCPSLWRACLRIKER